MSRTNGDSTKDKKRCVGGIAIPKEYEIEMSANKTYDGPAFEKVQEGPVIDKKAFDSELREDGKLVVNGKLAARFSKDAFKTVKKFRKEREKFGNKNLNKDEKSR